MKLFFYIVIGFTLALAGIRADANWEFWVIMIGVCAIDFISGTSRK